MGLVKVGDIGHFVDNPAYIYDNPAYIYYVNSIYDGKPSEVTLIAGPPQYLGVLGKQWGTRFGYPTIFMTLFSASSLEKFIYSRIT